MTEFGCTVNSPLIYTLLKSQHIIVAVSFNDIHTLVFSAGRPQVIRVSPEACPIVANSTERLGDRNVCMSVQAF